MSANPQPDTSDRGVIATLHRQLGIRFGTRFVLMLLLLALLCVLFWTGSRYPAGVVSTYLIDRVKELLSLNGARTIYTKVHECNLRLQLFLRAKQFAVTKTIRQHYPDGQCAYLMVFQMVARQVQAIAQQRFRWAG